MKIITVTPNPALDKIYRVERILPVRKLRCSNPAVDVGGGGLNLSRAIRLLGGASRAYYFKGGLNGVHVDRILTAEGIAHRGILIRDETRENMSFFENGSETHFRFVPEGPVLDKVDPGRLFKALEKIGSPADLVVGSGSLPPGAPADFYARLARLARRMGARCVIDTSGAALAAAAGKGVYLAKPNLRELGDLTGRKLESPAAQDKAAMRLIRQKAFEVLVVSLGPEGALVASDRGCRRFAAPPVRVQSPIGAGDSMTAGIVLALAKKWDLHDAVRYGVAVGSATAMTPGNELCRPADVRRLHQKMLREERSRGR